MHLIDGDAVGIASFGQISRTFPVSLSPLLTEFVPIVSQQTLLNRSIRVRSSLDRRLEFLRDRGSAPKQISAESDE